jgi:hypothetical protein
VCPTVNGGELAEEGDGSGVSISSGGGPSQSEWDAVVALWLCSVVRYLVHIAMASRARWVLKRMRAREVVVVVVVEEEDEGRLGQSAGDGDGDGGAGSGGKGERGAGGGGKGPVEADWRSLSWKGCGRKGAQFYHDVILLRNRHLRRRRSDDVRHAVRVR